MFRCLARCVVGCVLTLATVLSPTAFAGAGWAPYMMALEGAIPGSKCELYGVDGFNWSQRQNLSLAADQIKSLLANFDKPDALRASGFRVGTALYPYASAMGNVRHFKHKMADLYAGKSAKSLTICLRAPAGATTDPKVVGEIEKLIAQLKTRGF